MGASWSDWANEQRRELKKRVERMEKGKRRLNVLLVGTPGVGKSSLLNSLAAAYTTDYVEIAGAGAYTSGSSFTHRVRRYDMLENHSHSLPGCAVFIDFVGMQNKASLVPIIKAVCEGRIRNKRTKNMLELVNSDATEESLRKEYPDKDSAMMIDVILFVAACTEEVPTNLAKSVTQAAIELGGIPVYSVLTKKDMKPSDYERRKEDLERSTGTFGSARSIQVSAYSAQSGFDAKEKEEMNYYLLKLWVALESPFNIRSEVDEDQQREEEEERRRRETGERMREKTQQLLRMDEDHEAQAEESNVQMNLKYPD